LPSSWLASARVKAFPGQNPVEQVVDVSVIPSAASWSIQLERQYELGTSANGGVPVATGVGVGEGAG